MGIFYQGRCHVEAVGMGGVNQSTASGQNYRSRRAGPLHCRRHSFQLLRVDHRTEIVLIAGTDFQPARALDQHIPEPLVDGLKDDDAAAGGTALAGVAEGG
jgi:hypothetical protein